MPKTYTYTVEGRGTFPADMLRYDRCWPKTEQNDVPEIQATPRYTRDPKVAQKAHEVIEALKRQPDLMQEILAQLMEMRDTGTFRETRRVQLTGEVKPTKDRWASFGWTVVAEGTN